MIQPEQESTLKPESTLTLRPAPAPNDPAETRLLRTIGDYLRPADVAAVAQALAYARQLEARQLEAPTNAATDHGDLLYVVAVAQTLAETLHIDAVTLVAVVLAQAVERGDADLATVRARLGEPLGAQVALTIEHIEQFDMLQRPGAALRRQALRQADAAPADRGRRRSQERRRQQDADTLRKMFVEMAEDPRVVVIKIADHLRLMRNVRAVADAWRAALVAGAPAPDAAPATPLWTLDECRQFAEETRALYAPLAGRLGMGRVEGELEDLAFAILQPDEYAWLRDAVAVETKERRSYVDRVCDILRDELERLNLHAEISGRVKHLYSIYKKVVRSGSRDLSQLYDILAFRIIVGTVDDCYLALAHVHELWRPMDNRYKDFITIPKTNGYQSLHTTVFCLDDQLAEIQIRTREMHQMAEYGVAMHWYYKDVGDSASAKAKPLQAWAQQVVEWQQELQEVAGSGSGAGGDDDQAKPGAAGAEPQAPMQEQIFVFTPAGDVKDLPAGATPLDFAYRVHTNLGDHVVGVRITQDDGSGRPIKRLAPLDYELHNGDVIEIIKRNDAHPTRDWLRVVKTKLARNRILRYLKIHERDVDIQVGRERLDRELRSVGLRRGYDELGDDDLGWLAREFKQSDAQSLLAAIGSGRLKVSGVTAKAHERLRPPALAEAAPAEALAPLSPRETAPQSAMSVAGVVGLMTRLATCCNPLPGDELCGFITRGRGVVIHRADCPNMKSLLARNPERGVAVAWPSTLDEHDLLRAPIIVEAGDRTALLRDVTEVISGLKINMFRVEVNTNPRTHLATINAVLEIHRAEQLDQALSELRTIPNVISAERKQPKTTAPARAAKPAKVGKAGKTRSGADHRQ